MEDDKIKGFVIEGMGLILGVSLYWSTELLSNEREFVGITNPRVVQVDHKNMSMSLSPMIGSPNEILFIDKKPVIYYEIVDEKIITLYNESVTGIKIARQMPNNLTVLK
jgi:hypothetical protein